MPRPWAESVVCFFLEETGVLESVPTVMVEYAELGGGILGEAETNSGAVVWGWSVSWGQVPQGLE